VNRKKIMKMMKHQPPNQIVAKMPILRVIHLKVSEENFILQKRESRRLLRKSKILESL
jgi:hypothetical protein